MAKEREHQLFTELRAARIELAAAIEAQEEAGRVLAEKKTVRRKFDLLIEEILDEITTGKRRDSLIEYAEVRASGRAAGPESETADERQRGPTVTRSEAFSKAAERAGLEPLDIGGQVDMCGLHPGSWRDIPTRDVVTGMQIRNQLKHMGYSTLGELADDAEADGLFDLLGQYLDRTEIVSVEHDLAKWVRKHPKGFPAKLVEDLGKALVGEDETEAPASPPLGTADPVAGRKAAGMRPAAPVVSAWLISESHVVDGEMRRSYVGSVEAVDERRAITAARRKFGPHGDYRAEPRPEDVPVGPPLGTADPFEFVGADLADDIEPDVATEDEVMDALHDAIFPDPAPADWKGWGEYKRVGHISDADALRELGEIWPSRITYVEAGGDSGYTVRGGPSPAFWYGVLPPGKLPEADLYGPNLAIAVRSLLRIPEPSGAPALPGKAETPPAKVVSTLHDAVQAAFDQLVPEVKARLKAGATDEEIGHALPSLPTSKWAPGSDGGTTWAASGGSEPALWFGIDVRTYPDRKYATLNFDKLIGAVRLACKIPRPRTAAEPRPKPRKSKTAVG
jgi:hypothetical protein